jgi:hypothetical protein
VVPVEYLDPVLQLLGEVPDPGSPIPQDDEQLVSTDIELRL